MVENPPIELQHPAAVVTGQVIEVNGGFRGSAPDLGHLP